MISAFVKRWLGIFSEGVVTFGASEKLRRRFVAAPRLHLPDINQHVAAFGALHAHGGHGFNLVFFADNGHLLLQGMFYDFGAYLVFAFSVCVGLDVAAFGAGKNYCAVCFFGYKACAIVWTKLHLNISLSVLVH